MEAKARISTINLVITALFIALSFVGANIKIFGTIAFDSLPAFLAALLLGPVYGAAIGFLGHLFTALTSGFPLGVPMHMVIAVSMAITMLGFGTTYRGLKSKIPTAGGLAVTVIVGIILNGPVSLALSMGAMALMAGKDAAFSLLAMLPVLILASAANILISIIVFKSMEKIRGKIA